MEIDGGAADLADIVLNELREDEWSAQEIRYEGETRLVRVLVEDERASNGALPLRHHGVYLITAEWAVSD